MQVADPVGDTVPAVQGWQLVEPPGEAVPVAQGWHPRAPHAKGSLPAGQLLLAPVQPAAPRDLSRQQGHLQVLVTYFVSVTASCCPQSKHPLPVLPVGPVSPVAPGQQNIRTPVRGSLPALLVYQRKGLGQHGSADCLHSSNC